MTLFFARLFFGTAELTGFPLLISTGLVNMDNSDWVAGVSGYAFDFDGQIDDVRVYNRGLSAAEIAVIAQ